MVLTATYAVGGATRSVAYPVSVAAQLSDTEKVDRDLASITIPNVGDIRTNVTVPSTGALGPSHTVCPVDCCRNLRAALPAATGEDYRAPAVAGA